MTFAWRLHFSPRHQKIQQRALILKSIKRKQHSKQTNKSAQPSLGKGSFFSCGFLCAYMLWQVQDVSDCRTLRFDVWRELKPTALHRAVFRIHCQAPALTWQPAPPRQPLGQTLPSLGAHCCPMVPAAHSRVLEQSTWVRCKPVGWSPVSVPHVSCWFPSHSGLVRPIWCFWPRSLLARSAFRDHSLLGLGLGWSGMPGGEGVRGGPEWWEVTVLPNFTIPELKEHLNSCLGSMTSECGGIQG